MLRPAGFVFIAMAVLSLYLTPAPAVAGKVVAAKGSVELTDPAGDVSPITTSAGSYPGMDVIKLSISSDGQKITFKATLKDPPPDFASSVLEIYFDTDLNRATGAKLFSYKGYQGWDYMAELQACIMFENGLNACTGGSSKSKPKFRYAAINMVHYPTASENKKKELVSALGFPGRKASLKTPIKGKEIVGVVEYADLKVKPGQTIGILVHEACSRRKVKHLFPEVRLTLK